MKVLHAIAELGSLPGPVFLAVGVFDGVHLGHQAVIRRALEDAKGAGGTAVVVTFDPHPVRVSGRTRRRVCSPPQVTRSSF